MNPLLLLALAAALAMDAFAVSLAISLLLGRPSRAQTFRLAFSFGLFQFLMPVAGWLAGRGIRAHIEGVDHWIAFGLLVFIGGRMLLHAGEPERDGGCAACDPTCGASLLVLSVATSVDALAVGLSLSFLGVELLLPALVIGAVAFLLTALGMRIGPLAGRLFGRRAEIAGGLLLIAIGIGILVDHLRA